MSSIAVLTRYLWKLENLQKAAKINGWPDVKILSVDTSQRVNSQSKHTTINPEVCLDHELVSTFKAQYRQASIVVGPSRYHIPGNEPMGMRSPSVSSRSRLSTEERVSTERDPEYEEHEQDPKAFLNSYHEAILNRAMHRPDISPTPRFTALPPILYC